jgi:hypothetical protein
MALAAPALIGAAGLSVETGYWFYLQKSAQKAADVAAYAGAVTLRNGGASSAAKTEAAAAVLAETGLLGYATPDETVTSASPPSSGSNLGNDRAMEVTINYEAPRFFSSIFNNAPVLASVRSVAAYQQGAKACLLALDIDDARALELTGSSVSTLLACEVMSNSISPESIYMSGNGALTTDCANAVGGVVVKAPGFDLTLADCDAPREDMARALDPYADVPEPNLSGLPCSAVGAATAIDAGAGGVKRFCGGLALTADRDFAPGVYVVDGGVFQINAGANITGDGVTFFLTNNAVAQFNGSATINLSAPTSGTYAGLLIMADRDDDGLVHQFNGAASSQLTGAIYTPASQTVFNGNFSGSDGCMQIVAAKVKVSGNLNLETDCAGYGLKSAEVPASVRLVE